MAESNPRFSTAQRQTLHAQPLTREQLAAITGATILPADRTVTDGEAFTADDTRLFTSGFLVDDTAPGTATEGDLTTARVTPSRVQRHSPGNDTGTPVTYGAGAVAATTPRTTLASNDPAVTALEIIDDWDETDRCKTNPIAGQAGVQGGSGLITALTQRVTIATDDEINDDLDAIRVALEIIDDWDETNRAAVNPIAGQVGVQGGSGLITALTQRVTIATDDEINDDLDSIRLAVEIMDDWDETNRAAVNLIAGQVAITADAGVVAANTPRVTLASNDPAVTALNTLVTQGGGSGGGLVTLQASQVAAIVNGTTTRTTTTSLGAFRDLAILINITAGGAATGTLQLFLQDSADGGTTWDDLVASNTFTFGAAGVTQRFFISGRLVTTAAQGSAVLNGALAAGTVRNGPWGDRIRVQEVVSGIAGGPTGPTYQITTVAK